MGQIQTCSEFVEQEVAPSQSRCIPELGQHSGELDALTLTTGQRRIEALGKLG